MICKKSVRLFYKKIQAMLMQGANTPQPYHLRRDKARYPGRGAALFAIRFCVSRGTAFVNRFFGNKQKKSRSDPIMGQGRAPLLTKRKAHRTIKNRTNVFHPPVKHRAGIYFTAGFVFLRMSAGRGKPRGPGKTGNRLRGKKGGAV